jgi:hypothetical protein
VGGERAHDRPADAERPTGHDREAARDEGAGLGDAHGRTGMWRRPP